MIEYTCELCLKEFNQKIDYTRHKNKKNACVSIEQLRKIEEKNAYNDNSQKELTTLFSNCMNMFRDSEHLTGDKALRNLSYLLVLRLIEPMIGKEIDFDSYNYDLGEWQSKKDKLLEFTHFSKIASSKEENIPNILSHVWDLILSQYPKTKDIFLPGKGFDIKKQTTFVKLIKNLNEFDFSAVSVDIQGHAYEDLLKEIMTGKILGQYFTQPLVKNLMVEIVNPRLYDDGTCETTFDPAVGTAGLLMTSHIHMKKQAKTKGIKINWDFMTSKGLCGREAEPDTFQMAKANMLISSGHMFTGLEQGDSIRDPITNKYDIVLANPPFGIKGLKYREIDSHLRDSYMPIESKSAVPLFLQAIISILKIGGRCCMVMPVGQELFGKNKGQIALREYLMKTCDLKEIYIMPSGVFTNTSIKTCVVYFHKKKDGNDVVKIDGKKTRTYKFSKTRQTKKVKFYDYNPYEKVKNLLVEVDIERLVENEYSLNYAEYLNVKDEDEEDEKNVQEIGWKTLGEVCEIKNGKRIVKSKVQSGDYPVYGGGDITSFYTNIYSREGINCKISREGMSEHNCVLIIKGKFYLNSQGLTIHSKNIEEVMDKYVWYYLLENKQMVFRCGRGTAQKAIDIPKFQGLKIPVPPLPVQQRIVEQLDFLYEQSIKTSQQRIKELNKERSMWVEILTTGEEEKTLGEVCLFKKGKQLSRKNMTEGQYPVIGGGQQPAGYHNEFNMEKNTVLCSSSGAYAGFISRYPQKVWASDCFAIIPNKTIINDYLYYYLSQTQQNIYKLQNGAAQPHVYSKDITKLKIPVPPLSIQQTIIERCEHIDTLITNLEHSLEQNKELAKLLLEKMLYTKNEDSDVEDSSDSDVTDTE